ncbi:MAG: hypothetical protein HYW22_01755 [Candidatus Aenigmarchaeota archaeon]|nr:hypothetical protein [Candidatus Aenigmarchaeota archaeon]
MILPYGRQIAERELSRLIRQSDKPDELTGIPTFFEEYIFQRDSTRGFPEALDAYLKAHYTGSDRKIVEDTLNDLAMRVNPSRSYA